MRISLIVILTLLGLHPAVAQTSFTEGNQLSDRTYNSDNGPTNSQLTLDFPIAQAGTLQAILVWGETDGQSMSGIGQSFQAFVLRPAGTNYQVVFETTNYLTVTSVGTNTFVIPGPSFGLLPGDVVAHYGRGIPFSNGTGGPSSVYIAVNLPEPTVGEIIAVGGPVYPLYNDGGRNYAIQVLVSSFVVTTTNDAGAGSLRQAALTAAPLPGTSTISFAPNLSGQTILLTSGPITLTNNVNIDASPLANGIQINPNYNSRIFTINNATVILNSLTLTNGNGNYDSVYGGNGGTIQNNFGTVTVNNCVFTENASYYAYGGAIANLLGTMTVNNCTFENNFADAPVPQLSTYGGGAIYNQSAHLTVNNCSFIGNSATNGLGGGIYCAGTYSFTANNCTFVGNQANSGNGGAIYDGSGATLVVNNCTLATNQASGGNGGGIYTSGNLNLTNSIVCSNSATTGAHIYCGGFLTVINPLITVGSGSSIPSLIYYHNNFVSGGEIDTTNPLLAPLANYGGPTPTMPPMPGSPAIDAGVDSVTRFLTTDQRGVPRKSGAHVDIGAVEVGPIDTNTVVTTTADSGFGSLRLVVLDRNTFGSPNLITFTNKLSGQTILLTSGQIVVDTNVTIDASPLAKGIQINGNGQSRIFEIDNNGAVVLNSLTLTNGNDNNDPNLGGGAILNHTTLTVTNCVFAGNQANGSEYGGGGIFNSAPLTVNNCTFTGNQANNTPYGGGGGISCIGTETVTVNNSTITGNQANNGGGGGGGIVGPEAGAFMVNNSTFTGNQANNSGFGGGGILNESMCRLTNTIICLNSASAGAEIYNDYIMSIANCLLGPESLASSIDNQGGTYSIANSVAGVNPLLAPLGNYGGLTQTMPPEPGSPAIDAGNDSVTSFLVTDQSGLARKSGTHVDIGAVEVQSGQVYSIVENILDSGAGSLRQVLSNAPAGATITFDASLSGQIITLTSGQIVLSNSPTINASGLANGIQINGHGSSRIFQVLSTSSAILSGLTLTNGNPGAGNPGGAILNNGLLFLSICTLAGNSSAYGGALENQNTCEVLESTFTGNSTSGGGGANGGAIDNDQGPRLILLQCTLAGNTAAGSGGGIANYQSTLAMTNCIIAGNTASGSLDINNFPSSTINAGGTNLVQFYVNSGTFNGAGSLVSKAPLLASLGNYGGLTPTMPPLSGSPAIDGGSAAALASEGFSVDQRGYPRVSGARVDIGAVEVQIAAASFPLTGLTKLGNGSLQFGLPNLVGGSFTVFATTNLALPFNTWSNLGPVLETPVGSGVFQFTDPQATNFTNRFYRVSSP